MSERSGGERLEGERAEREPSSVARSVMEHRARARRRQRSLGSTAGGRSWLDDEPGWGDAKRELGCIVEKAARRWWLCLLIAAICAGIAATWRAEKPMSYPGTVVLRVTESDDDVYADRNQSTSLATEIEEISLSRTVILEVMEEFDLDPNMRRLDPTFAANNMRDDVDVTLVQNYFSKQRDDKDPFRSARVSITFEHPDPEVAVLVARALARRVVQQQLSSQEVMAELMVDSASNVVVQLKRAIQRAREEQTTTYLNALTLDDADSSGEFVRVASLRAEIKQLESSLQRARSEYAGLDLKRAFTLESMAMRFEVIDEGQAERVQFSRAELTTITGMVGFLAALLVAVLLVGAFDPRVYDAATMKRLDLPVVGHIP